MIQISNLNWVTPAMLERAQTILAGMSIEQKAGQVFCVGIDGLELEPEAKELIQKYGLGGIILFGRNIEDVDQVGRLVYEIQLAARQVGHPGAFIAIDQEGGRVLRLTEANGFTEVLSAMGMGATGDPNVAYLAGVMLAQEMKAVGINFNLAPTTDIALPFGEGTGDKTRAFSSDPETTGEFGQRFIRGTQDSGVMACAKGFPGSHRPEQGKNVDSHLALPVVQAALDELEAHSLVPLRACLRAKPASVMMGHIYLPQIETSGVLPASVSPACVRIVREHLGFEGLLITDSLEMGALPDAGFPVDLASAAALKAGCDILLHQRNHDDHRRSISEVLRQIESGEIPMERLDEAVLRILLFKARYGLLDLAPKDPQLKRMPGVEERRQTAREQAYRAITVLKNERGLLPLKREQEVMVIEYGPAHGTTWQPGIAQPGQIRGLGERLGAKTYVLEYLDLSDEEIQEICEQGHGHVVIAITSEAVGYEFQQRLIDRLQANIDDLVVIAMRGPYDIQAFPTIHTYVATYGFNPAHMDALVKVLKGQKKPQGKLPVEIEGLFPRGFSA